MVSPASTRTKIVVDPVALLKREHRMILDRLLMVETAMSSRSVRGGAVQRTNRETLRELLEFFTGPVDVHFTREAMLVGSLRRILGREQEAPEQFQGFLDEHRALKADAAAVMSLLAGKRAGGLDATASTSFRGWRTLTGQLNAMIRRYREQIASEERLLFALAEMRLSAEQRRRISRRMLQV
ncbi:MAG TPA: hemerythrin domain-containing protein [Nitrospira sp.]|nr:hemerythrin domain-containing protein [Nitrospira sp.]